MSDLNLDKIGTKLANSNGPLVTNMVRTEEEKRAISISQKSIYTYQRVLSALEYFDKNKFEWFHLGDDYLAQNLENIIIAIGMSNEFKRREEKKDELTATKVSAIIDALEKEVKPSFDVVGNRHERRAKRKKT